MLSFGHEERTSGGLPAQPLGGAKPPTLQLGPRKAGGALGLCELRAFGSTLSKRWTLPLGGVSEALRTLLRSVLPSENVAYRF